MFDTNIVLICIRSDNYEEILRFVNPQNVPVYISIATEAEIKSIAIQNNWGMTRRLKLDAFLDQVNIVEIGQALMNAYVQIDSFSQCRNPAFKMYPFPTHRNMGKNDLWIASLLRC
ncbi:PilT protein domain protein [Mucilaginibacter paludis DSM 18603]|uniref:PilT protein domain protein n=1 Tax=Mucilaginibacter paludis DSM 18603 TaxID=714943 RepID=H1YC53_9SPHI|nr:PilT protein domain protein [Mucilaginibacter paludis DSM 18603]